MTKNELEHPVLQSILSKIENLVGDDFAVDIGMALAQEPEKLSPNEKIFAERFSKIYRLVHAFNIDHSCFDVHEDWRNEETK